MPTDIKEDRITTGVHNTHARTADPLSPEEDHRTPSSPEWKLQKGTNPLKGEAQFRDQDNSVVLIASNSKEVMTVGVGEENQEHSRTHSDQFLVSFKDVRQKPPTFEDTSVIALEFLNSGYEFDDGSIIFNQFKPVISYKTEKKPIFSLNTIVTAETMSVYDDIDADVLQNNQEYNLANLIYYSLKESTTSEQSASMTAMDNTSKNASDIIDKLTLTLNHTCQAVITMELIEIISGTAALD